MYQDSVQSFVRALRAPTDPPQPGDLSKIDIASEAWCATSFNVPRKAEIILDWCLTRLLKDGTQDSGPNPVLDLRYWKLLHGVCLSVNSESSKTASIGSTWLRPLLNRLPLLPIVLSLLSNSQDLPAQKRSELYLQSSKSLSFFWTLAAPKFAHDSLLDCFGAVLRVIETASGEVSGLFEICGLVTSSLRATLSNVTNKKKLSQSFITSHMGVWLNLTAKGSAALPPVYAEMCDVGFELLFNADNLKQIADDPHSNSLFDTLRSHISSSPAHLLSALPILMAEFINAMKKRRSLLSSTGGSFTVDAHSSVAVFLSFCGDTLRAPGLPQTQVWRSRLDLLKVVESKSLFGPGYENMVVLLKEEAEVSVGYLVSTDDANIQSVIQCLCVLSRIDHSFVGASMSRILSRFFTIFQSSGEKSFTKPAHEFLSLTISYHAKTRTLPVHISRLVDSCTVSPPHISSIPVQMSYDGLVASPILTTSHLDKLSKAVRAFITPGQILDTATRVLATLRDIWERVRDVGSAVVREPHARKKSRTTGRSGKAKEDADTNGVTFVLAARIAATVLSSLPLHSATDAVQMEVQATVKGSLDGFVREAILMGTNVTVSGDTGGNIWAAQVVAAAALRLQYLLQLSAHACYAPDYQSDSEGLFPEVLAVENRLPEYSVEIFRHLFHHGPHRTVEQQRTLFEAVLNFLEVHLPVHQSAPKVWSGRSSQLSCGNDGSALAAVALLRLVLDRHLDIVNVFASSVQRRRLVNLMNLAHVEPEHEGAEYGLSLVTTVHECLHSANFWELENIRSSFFVVQQERTAFLDTIDVAKIQGGGKRCANGQHVKDQMPDAMKSYTFLLHAPSECLPKSSRGDFLRRAVVLDFLLGSVTTDPTDQAIQIVRTFLFRTLNFLGSWEHEANGRYLRHLMTSPVPISAERVTEELVQGHLLASFRAAVQGSTDKLLDAIQICREHTLGGRFLLKGAGAPLRSSTQRLMDTAMTEFSVSTFPPDVVDHLSSLSEHVLDQLHPILRRLATSDAVEPDEIINYTDMFLLWGCTIAFGKYLHRPKNPSPGLGTQIIGTIGPSFLSRGPEDARILKVCSAMLAILVSELRFYSGEEESDGRESHLQRIVTSYVAFVPSSIERCDFDENMARLLRTLSPSDFLSCLQFVFEALSACGMTSEMMTRLIRLASLALHNAPQNTLKIVQAFDKKCLDVFVGNAKLSDAHITRSSILIFIRDLCSKRPASLRLQNLMSIWVLLSRFLAGSKAHDTMTDTSLFHHIVSVLSALVRLRRDLVITTLPHLGNIMRQLIFALRSPRPILGAKQHAIVANTLPAWINPSHPLGVEESKELSRLFTSLSAKTLVRVHGPSAEIQKPESLARPLSKHVACVLQAYLDVLNDPLCVLAADIRRELQPGLFVLCDILNDHTRDALMVSALDVGGKAAMKGLWKEYEKQRYIGKG